MITRALAAVYWALSLPLCLADFLQKQTPYVHQTGDTGLVCVTLLGSSRLAGFHHYPGPSRERPDEPVASQRCQHDAGSSTPNKVYATVSVTITEMGC
jgi:hypothetical protein